MKSKDLQSRLLYTAKFFRIEGQIKSFPDKKKLKEFITTKLILKNIKGEQGGGEGGGGDGQGKSEGGIKKWQ